MNPANFPRNKKRKQEEAKARQTAWDAISLIDQVKELDTRPGNSAKQRVKIQKAQAFEKEVQKKKK
jgi:hypothetical protein